MKQGSQGLLIGGLILCTVGVILLVVGLVGLINNNQVLTYSGMGLGTVMAVVAIFMVFTSGELSNPD